MEQAIHCVLVTNLAHVDLVVFIVHLTLVYPGNRLGASLMWNAGLSFNQDRVAIKEF